MGRAALAAWLPEGAGRPAGWSVNAPPTLVLCSVRNTNQVVALTSSQEAGGAALQRAAEALRLGFANLLSFNSSTVYSS